MFMTTKLHIQLIRNWNSVTETVSKGHTHFEKKKWALGFCKSLLKIYDEMPDRADRIAFCQAVGISRPDVLALTVKVEGLTMLTCAGMEVYNADRAHQRLEKDYRDLKEVGYSRKRNKT